MRRLLLLPLVCACAPVDATVAPGAELPLGTDTTEGDTDADTHPEADDTCAARVAWLSPAADTAHVPVETLIQAAFDTPLPATADWRLAVAGLDGATSLSPDRRLATFTPSAPLQPDTTYDVTAEACGDQATASFRTLGPPIDLGRLAGRTWNVDLAALSWVSPASSSALLPLLDMPAVLTHVSVDADGLHLEGRFAASIDGVVLPIPCAPAFDLGRLTLAGNPRFTTDATGFAFKWQGQDLRVEDIHVEGVIDDQGTTLDSLSFRGLLDVRPLQAITGIGGLCAQAEAYGEACEPCTDGVVACLPALVTDGVATEVDAASFDRDVLDLLGLCP